MRVLVTGAAGILGRVAVTTLRAAGHDAVPAVHRVLGPFADDDALVHLDLTDPLMTDAVVREARPDWILHCAAYTNVDGAETDEAAAFALNRDGTHHLVAAADAHAARVVALGTDYVFGGRQPLGAAPRPWLPDDPVAPRGIYARSKRAGEEAVLASHGAHALVRTSWLFGEGGRNFLDTIVDRARSGQPLAVVDDQRGSPTYAPDLARGLTKLMEAGASGVYHAANAGECTWYDLACEAVRAAGLPDTPVGRTTTAALGRPAPRPAYSVLDTTTFTRVTGEAMPDWRDAVRRYFAAQVGRPSTS